MSTPETSPAQAGSQPTTEQPTGAIQSAPDSPSTQELPLLRAFPVFGLRDVLLVMAVWIAAALFCGLGFWTVVAILPGLKNMKPEQMNSNVPFLLGSQLITYAITLAFVYRLLVHHYRTPFLQAVGWCWPARWWRFSVGGASLSLLVLTTLYHLPVPREAPIDQFFRTSLAAWLMTTFGVLIAPFVEELFFRGILFPALARRTGISIAILVSASSFALIHAAQLGKNWELVLVIFCVGIVFTLIRHLSGSLAASVLSHMSYNGLVFAIEFVKTDGFRHMEKLAR